MPASIWRNMDAFYTLTGSKCGDCGSLHFPPAQACVKCGSAGLLPHKFSGGGTIETYTTIRQSFNDDTDRTRLIAGNPYAIAIIRLDEGPMITAQVTDIEQDELKPRARVKSVFRKISEEGEDGLIKYGYKFTLQ